MKKGLLLLLFIISITLLISLESYGQSRNNLRSRKNRSFEIGFLVNKSSNENIIHQYAPVIGVNYRNFHIDAALNTLEPYSRTRVESLPCKSKYTKTQFTSVNFGYNIAIVSNYKYSFYAIPKVGLYYQCDIHTSECFDTYTIMNEKYNPNFDVDLAFYLPHFQNLGFIINVGSVNYNFGLKLSKFF